MNNKKQLIKKCKHCGLESEDMSLYCRSYNRLKSGEISISYKNKCSKCNWELIKKNPSFNMTTKLKFIRTLKESVPCMDCNKKFPYYVMDFDHVTNDKSFEISTNSGKSLENIKKEIEKCEIVCSNCHRIRTHKRRNNIVLE